MAKILILGGDGYLGWPTAMHLSAAGHQVLVADNYFRRDICSSPEVGTLYKVPNLQDRCKRWAEISNKQISAVVCDLAEPEEMRRLFDGSAEYVCGSGFTDGHTPDAVIHYAEQPSAPYSVSDYKKADFTIVNNLRVTNNVMWCLRDFCPATHLIKLGTMGEYGTPNIDIEEGWIDITHNGRSDKFLFPRQGGSIYHTTKVMDTDLLWWGVRMWDLRVTDLMQGPVYGLETAETIQHNDLRTIFNYDEVFGTVVNRFVVQASMEHPLTVYGAGGQTRGYLNIKDTLQCVAKALEFPAESGELRIFNQITETLSVNEIASLVVKVGRERGLNTEVKSLPNPRKEAESHYYNPKYQGLQDIGVVPTFLDESVLNSMFDLVDEHRDSLNPEVIFNGVKWN